MADTITELLLEKTAGAPAGTAMQVSRGLYTRPKPGLGQRFSEAVGTAVGRAKYQWGNASTGKKIGAGALGAAALAGGGMAAAKLMKRKSLAKRMMGAMKRNKGAVAGGAAGAAALGAGGYAYSRRR